jgi:lipid-binding SYLF domain-containing protein
MLKRSLLLFVITSFGIALAQDAATRRQEIDLNAQSTLEELFAQKGNARELYDQSVGYAVFSATKAGFVVSGGRGTGVVVNKSSGQRTYMRLFTGGIGLGVGAQNYDLFVLFQTESKLNQFITGTWDASTSAQAAAGTEGVTFMSSFVDGVALYQITDKGLMAWADVSGTRFKVVSELN